MPEYPDENGKSTWTRIVYVIALEKDACSDKRATCGGCSKKPVYVGESCHSAKKRFAQHKAGYKASYWVKRYGVRVTTGHTKGLPEFATVEQLNRAERRLARELNDTDRYCVYGGH
jgi:hypothetical protein